MIYQDGGIVTAEEAAEVLTPPKKYEYTLEDFMGAEPYEKLYEFISAPFLFQTETAKMAMNAAEVGFKGFKNTLKAFLDAQKAELRRNMIPNQTEFDGPYQELDCGEWHCSDWGIYRDSAFGNRELACAHPIMPVERLVNIDTGECKLKLAYKRPGKDKKWQTAIVGKDVVSNTRKIVDALSPIGISVTSETAKALVAYLNDIENRNYDIIPESKSIGRLGYIPGEGFSPFVEGLVFDGDASFRHLYETIKSHGSQIKWYETAMECRRMSVTARIMLAAAFAAPLLSVVGALPFFVHLWGGTETGKTVALMLASSVWGNPDLGSYTQTFNATQVGQERAAAFLNHLPSCIDELQLTLNGKGKTSFDVYQLAQGVGRLRGKKVGGVEAAPTWKCCFLTTGESPLTTGSSGGGAVNRVLDIECTNSAVISDGPRISNALKQNYGFAGRIFAEKLYEDDRNLDIVREIYSDNFRELCSGNSTEKQAMAAAAIITADQLATHWIFQDGMELTAKDIADFLASREAVSAGRRAYDWLCDWVAANVNHFNTDEAAAQGETYGVLESGMAYIIRGVFDRVVQDAGFSTTATLSYLRSNKLIETRSGKGYAKTKRIGRTAPQCVWLHLDGDGWASAVDEEDLLPL